MQIGSNSKEDEIRILQNQVLELSRKNRMKDEFLTLLSDELRTPLNAILGWTNLLLNEKSLDEGEMAQALDTINRNSEILLGICDDLLDTSRITL